MGSPKITVVVPVYNTENTLEKCILSILRNTFQSLEVVIINDASPQGRVCDEYLRLDARVRVIHHSHNKGLSAARNEGVRQAKGEFVSFVDSDDWIRPDMLEAMYDLAQKHHAQIISCGMDEHFNGKNRKKTKPGTTDTVYTGKEALAHLLLSHHTAPHTAAGKLYARDVFLDIYYPEGRAHEDAATTYKLYHKANMVVHTHIPYYCYAIHNQGIANSGFKLSSMDKLVAATEILDFIAEHVPDLIGHAHCFQIVSALRLAASFTPVVVKANGDAYRQVTSILLSPLAAQNKHLSMRHKVLLYMFKYCKLAFYYSWRKRLQNNV